jgi:hypothetical protein
MNSQSHTHIIDKLCFFIHFKRVGLHQTKIIIKKIIKNFSDKTIIHYLKKVNFFIVT